MLAVASASPLRTHGRGNKVICPNESGRSQAQRGRMGKLVALCLQAKATARIRQPGTSHIARSSGAAAGRVSNDEALPAVCDGHVQQPVPAVPRLDGQPHWPACPPCLDSLHCSDSRPPDGDSWTVTRSTTTRSSSGPPVVKGRAVDMHSIASPCPT